MNIESMPLFALNDSAAGCRPAVLIGCEKSGVVREAFRRQGFDAWSCDIEPSEGAHIKGDIIEAINSRQWSAMVLHPECRRVCVSGNHVYAEGKPKFHERQKAAQWIDELWQLAIKRCDMVALENSIGVLPTMTKMGPPTQLIQPYRFGENASKETALWLYGLPALKATKRVPGRFVEWEGKLVERWANQTDSGQNKLGPSETRSAERAQTYPGIADAMAKQWGGWIRFQVAS